MANLKSNRVIGYFWDLENCRVPWNVSTSHLVKTIRDQIGLGVSEVEFIVVCDVRKERQDIIDALNNAQITVIHVSSTAKNAADDKLKTCLKKFGNTYQNFDGQVHVTLMSGDINFASELADLRYRCGFNITILFFTNCSQSLKEIAHFTIPIGNLLPTAISSVSDNQVTNSNSNQGSRLFLQQSQTNQFVANQPIRQIQQEPEIKSKRLQVSNLPFNQGREQVIGRLKQLSNNCGGRVTYVSTNHHNPIPHACLDFPSARDAGRARRRMHGQNVYGNMISVRHIPDYAPPKLTNQNLSYSFYQPSGSQPRMITSTPVRRQNFNSRQATASASTSQQQFQYHHSNNSPAPSRQQQLFAGDRGEVGSSNRKQAAVTSHQFYHQNFYPSPCTYELYTNSNRKNPPTRTPRSCDATPFVDQGDRFLPHNRRQEEDHDQEEEATSSSCNITKYSSAIDLTCQELERVRLAADAADSSSSSAAADCCYYDDENNSEDSTTAAQHVGHQRLQQHRKQESSNSGSFVSDTQPDAAVLFGLDDTEEEEEEEEERIIGSRNSFSNQRPGNGYDDQHEDIPPAQIGGVLQVNNVPSSAEINDQQLCRKIAALAPIHLEEKDVQVSTSGSDGSQNVCFVFVPSSIPINDVFVSLDKEIVCGKEIRVQKIDIPAGSDKRLPHSDSLKLL